MEQEFNQDQANRARKAFQDLQGKLNKNLNIELPLLARCQQALRVLKAENPKDNYSSYQRVLSRAEQVFALAENNGAGAARVATAVSEKRLVLKPGKDQAIAKILYDKSPFLDKKADGKFSLKEHIIKHMQDRYRQWKSEIQSGKPVEHLKQRYCDSLLITAAAWVGPNISREMNQVRLNQHLADLLNRYVEKNIDPAKSKNPNGAQAFKEMVQEVVGQLKNPIASPAQAAASMHQQGPRSGQPGVLFVPGVKFG